MANPVPEQGYAYVAYKPCGCMVGAISDKPHLRNDIATETGRWLRAGLRVERVPTATVRTATWNCPHPEGRVPAQRVGPGELPLG